MWTCNFDQSTCPQLQSLPVGGDSEFLWVRNTGSTPTPGTGPTADHTIGGQGGEACFSQSACCSWRPVEATGAWSTLQHGGQKHLVTLCPC